MLFTAIDFVEGARFENVAYSTQQLSHIDTREGNDYMLSFT